MELVDLEHIASVLEAGMLAMGMTGEITVRAERASHTRWVGKASDQDVIIDVRITPAERG